jgi:WW domain-containing oxidoreductase
MPKTEKELVRWQVRGFGKRSTATEVARGANLQGKVTIVVGATAGIGLHAAHVMASLGGIVYATTRSLEKASKIPELQSSNIRIAELNLGKLKSVQEFAKLIKQEHKNIDHLILNAASVEESGITEDGYGVQFQGNHLGQYLLVRLLADVIGKEGTSRVVVLASSSYLTAPAITRRLLERISVSSGDSAGGFWGYGITKLCNILFAKELNRRFQEQGVRATANAVHPGDMIPTGIAKRAVTKFLLHLISPLTKSIPQGAATTVLVALAPEFEGIGGLLFADCKEWPTKARANDQEAMTLLWDFSEDLVKSYL